MTDTRNPLPLALLAGGFATRLRPLTRSLPKSLLDVNGDPFIAHQLRLLPPCFPVTEEKQRVAARRRGPVASPEVAGGGQVTGFFSFIIVAIAGEYIEQPGKVLAWTFLGVAAYQAWGTREAREAEAA